MTDAVTPFRIPDHDRTLIVALQERGYVVLNPEHLDRLERLLLSVCQADQSGDRAARLEASRVHGFLQAVVSAAAHDMTALGADLGAEFVPPYAGRHDWAEPPGWPNRGAAAETDRARMVTEREVGSPPAVDPSVWNLEPLPRGDGSTG